MAIVERAVAAVAVRVAAAAPSARTGLLFALLAALLALLPPAAGGQPAAPAIAFHYGPQPPLDELQAFDWVVLEPAHVAAADALPARHTRWFAYVSVGELDPQRPSSADVPAAWLRGGNAAWNTQLIDHTAPGWPDWFETRKIAPLWQQGWRGFFLDTLDAHRAFARTPAEQRAQEDALVALVTRLHARFPGIALIFNRGFEILPRLRGKVAAVAAESLYRGWDAAGSRYVEVPAADRDWLLGQLKRVQSMHGVPVVVIDYAPPAERARAREVAARIRAQGFVPYVSSGALDVLGVGDVEVQPRRIALVTDVPAGIDLKNASGLRFLGLPLHWLGYTIDIYDIRQPLPDLAPNTLLDGRTAAVVSWLSQPAAALNPRYPAWLRRQLDGGLKLVLMHALGIDADGALARELGFTPVTLKPGLLVPQARDPMFDAQPPRSGLGWEAPPVLDARDATGVRLTGRGQSLLRLAGVDGQSIDAAGITPWGGFALMPFALRPPMLGLQARWIVDPIAFLQRALAQPDLPPWPVPDVTTEGGRRLLFAHVDGDGFVSRAERPGAPFAGEVLLTDVLQRWPIPHTVSVIQGEIAGNGMFRELAPALEDIARRIFALPQVELASHSYSHPFRWRALAESSDGSDGSRGDGRRYEGALNLLLPGYRFDLRTEIEGSRDYIDQRLAPPGKRTRVFLWTGDTEPSTEAVQMSAAAGLLNMNGGDTLITRSEPSLTLAAGLGLRRGGALQVFAPMQNENVYTGNWTGPFYGYQRVIETFELTGAPRRLKPVNLYYHTYSATKAASLAALARAYDWALAQPLVPVYASDYIRKVLDFHALVIARDWRVAAPAWRVRGAGELRTLRSAPEAPLALAASRQVAGSTVAAGQRYLHLTAADALVVQAAEPAAADLPQVTEAAGWLSFLARNGRDLSFALNAYVQPAFTLAGADGCRTVVDGQPVAAAGAAATPRRAAPAAPATPAAKRGEPIRYELPAVAAGTTPQRFLVEVRCRP